MAVVPFPPKTTDAELFGELFAAIESAFAEARVPVPDGDLAALAMREWRNVERAASVAEKRARMRLAVAAVARRRALG